MRAVNNGYFKSLKIKEVVGRLTFSLTHQVKCLNFNYNFYAQKKPHRALFIWKEKEAYLSLFSGEIMKRKEKFIICQKSTLEQILHKFNK